MSTTNWSNKSWHRLLGLPVFVKVMGIAVGMALFLAAGLFWQIQQPYSRLEEAEVQAHAQFVALTLATEAAPLVRSENLAELKRLLEAMVLVTPAVNASIQRLEVRDGADRILAHAIHPTQAEDPGRLLNTQVGLPDGVPGSVSVTLDDAHIEFELAWHTRRILVTTGIIALLGMAATWWLMRIVIRPIHQLVASARSVKAGDYQTRAPLHARDEVGELAEAFNEMTATLQQKEAVNQLLLRKVIAAAETERKRVARELHDQTGQGLVSLLAGLAALDCPAHAEQIAALRSQATQSLDEVHDLSLMLRPRTLDDLGLVAALRDFTQSFARRHGIRVHCEAIGLDESARLPNEPEVALYRMVQESLNNAMRHGRAKSVDVLLQRREAGVLLVIEDDGQGFDASAWRAQCLRGDHLGLLGIEERAALLGGTLRVESRPGRGTGLFIEIPLQKDSHGQNPGVDRG